MQVPCHSWTALQELSTWYKMVRRARGAVQDLANAPATPPAAPYFNPSKKLCRFLVLAEAVLLASGPSVLAETAREDSAGVHTAQVIVSVSGLLLALLHRLSEPMKYTVLPGRHADALSYITSVEFEQSSYP